ncbi:MAG: hypothetical protein QW260_06805 [Thermoproteota archaeon]|nr:hypothetical protein [Candidatus Rehaiarchaeum fermentans]
MIDGGYPYHRSGTVLGESDPMFLSKKIRDRIPTDPNIIKFYDEKIIWNDVEFRSIEFCLYLNENAYLKYVFKDPKDKIIFSNLIQS